MNFSGCQNEDGVRRRFFERLEKRVEGRCGKHMDFVDDVNFVFALRGGKIDFVAQVADIVHAGVRSRIDLDEIHEAVFVDGLAIFAGVVGALGRVFVETVDCFCKQSRHRGFACAARASEKIGMTYSVCFDGIGEGLDNMLLSDHGIPLFWAVLAVEGLGHFWLVVCSWQLVVNS